MPRFFFHIIDSRHDPDGEGVELPGFAEARAQAIRTAGELLIEDGDEFWVNGTWSIVVIDEAGDRVFDMALSSQSRRHAD